jgi:ribose 5-phosphate isomerase A
MPVTIVERALELVPSQAVIGLGSGRAAWSFVRLLGQRVRSGAANAVGVATSNATAGIAAEAGVPLTTLAESGGLALTVDGADEVDPDLNLIKGYGRALVREKIVAAMSRRLVILAGEEKLVAKLGSRGRLPIEIVPFALPLVERVMRDRGWKSTLDVRAGGPFVTDNGNWIVDCAIGALDDPARVDAELRAIPGVVGTGLFLGMADVVLVGTGPEFQLRDEICRASRRDM